MIIAGCLFIIACNTGEELRVVSTVEGPIETNCYLLYGSKSGEAAIVDVAGTLDSLVSVIRDNDLHLKYIFVTHAHWDHVEGLSALKEKFPQAAVCMSREEYEAMQNYTAFAKETYPDRFDEYTQDSATAKMINTDLSAIEPDIFIADGDEYKLGRLIVGTIVAPGHSIGSVCYHCDNILFSGDVLFYRSAGNTGFYKASRQDLIESVRKIYALLPDSTAVYPGHDRITDLGSEKKENKYITVDGGLWGTE